MLSSRQCCFKNPFKQFRGKKNSTRKKKTFQCVIFCRCTARALVRWREHAKAQRRVFGVARKVAERMLHRYRTRIDDERGHHHGRSFDGLRFLALILFNLSVTKLIRNIRLQSFKKITAVTVLYAFVNLHDNCFTTNRNSHFLAA